MSAQKYYTRTFSLSVSPDLACVFLLAMICEHAFTCMENLTQGLLICMCFLMLLVVFC